MSFTTDPATRQAYITGLRDLADYLARHPAVPVPKYGTVIHLSAASADDDGCAQVTRFARHTGAALDNRLAISGHYEAARAFGPVGYQMTAISDAAMARHRAADTYYGCVTPDTWT
jgi:hypothetical protein